MLGPLVPLLYFKDKEKDGLCDGKSDLQPTSQHLYRIDICSGMAEHLHSKPPLNNVLTLRFSPARVT